MAAMVKRQTAYLCSISDLREGKYVRREGWEPSFFATAKGAVSRVRLAGVVVELGGSSLVIDDGTGRISLRVFDAPLPSVLVGDPVVVIGRPRVFGDEAYVLIEILRKASADRLKEFLALRDELAKYIPPVPEVGPEPVADEPVVLEERVVRVEGKRQGLLDIIRELDLGDGAPVDEVLARAGDGADRKLQFLIAEGEVFELRAGKVKVLE